MDVRVKDEGRDELVELKAGESVTIESSDESIYIQPSMFGGMTYVERQEEDFSDLPAHLHHPTYEGDGQKYVYDGFHLFTPKGKQMRVRSVRHISPRSIALTDFTGK